MTYIIAEPCLNTKDTACVDVCPVDCIHPRKDEAEFAEATQLYINPDECIDCGACSLPARLLPSSRKRKFQRNGSRSFRLITITGRSSHPQPPAHRQRGNARVAARKDLSPGKAIAVFNVDGT